MAPRPLDPGPSDHPWLVLFLLSPPRGEELLLVDALRRLGAHAVEPAGPRVAALFPAPPSVDALLWEVERVARASTTLTDPSLVWRWETRAQWSQRWTTEVETRRVTPRLVVASRGEDVGSGPGEVVVRLDPTTAFGTAAHATTRACLRFLDDRVRAGDELVDIGTGSGILAIAAVLLGARRVLALEADPIACSAARGNVSLNGVSDRVEVRPLEVTARSLTRLTRQARPLRYDGVMANVEAGVVVPLLSALPDLMAPGGWLVVSGVLEPERDQLVGAAAGTGLELGDEGVEGAWWTGWFSRAL
jgi:ribosomal protein L11 methyltransferase